MSTNIVQVTRCNGALSSFVFTDHGLQPLFGGLVVMRKEQYMEFSHGLENSGSRFLWVILPNSVTSDSTSIPPELAQGTEDRGYIFGVIVEKTVKDLMEERRDEQMNVRV
ncbi:hypothetical protein L6452_02163 [Arctium lappa]|uniref:Uncharacterized protein n=1 Tax=Arctium lappa TaxID=4217 RepID=A0ACB9FJB1_ARCLA|nr:hypothetical protein L6452_02163 [Arctium lappa]